MKKVNKPRFQVIKIRFENEYYVRDWTKKTCTEGAEYFDPTEEEERALGYHGYFTNRKNAVEFSKKLAEAEEPMEFWTNWLN